MRVLAELILIPLQVVPRLQFWPSITRPSRSKCWTEIQAGFNDGSPNICRSTSRAWTPWCASYATVPRSPTWGFSLVPLQPNAPRTCSSPATRPRQSHGQTSYLWRSIRQPRCSVSALDVPPTCRPSTGPCVMLQPMRRPALSSWKRALCQEEQRSEFAKW